MDPHHLWLDFVAFVCFYFVAILHHILTHGWRHLRTEHHIAAVLFGGIVHPATLDAIRDFLVHILVYSGYIVPTH